MQENRPFLVWSGRIEQEDFLKKKRTLGGTLENSPAATASVSSPPPALPQGCGGYQAQILSTGRRVHTSTGALGRWEGGEETGAAAAGKFPKVPPNIFLFEKILLLNPAAPYKEGPVLSHSPPLHLDPGLSRSGPNTARLSTLPRRHPQSLWVYHFVLIPLPVTSSNQVCLGAAQALFGRGGSR